MGEIGGRFRRGATMKSGVPAEAAANLVWCEGSWEAVYEKLEKLGSGAGGDCFRCRHRETGEDFAVKVMKPAYLGGLNISEAEREIALHLHSSVHHPRLIQLYHAYRSERGQLALVMEYAPGGDLFNHILDNGPVQPADACRLLVLLVETLIRLHAHGAAHRDIKLENLLLVSSEDVCDFRLCDLGGAKWFPKGAAPETHTSVGTKGYMAPEVYKRHPGCVVTYDAFKADVYGLGVVLYILLCGYPPWDLKNLAP